MKKTGLRITASDENMHVFGVTHNTVNRTGETNSGVSELFKALKQQGVKKLGVELHMPNELNEIDRSQGGGRYWRAVHLKAKRAGIELVPLADSTADSAITGLVGLMVGAIAAGHITPNYVRTQLQIYQQQLLRETNPEYQKIAKMLEKMLERFPELRKPHLESIYDALQVVRSRRMFEKAEKLKLQHIVVGAEHADDMKANHNATTTTIGEKGSHLAQRSQNYADYRTFTKELETIAEEPN